jgi:hypothetical protein
MEFKLLSLPEFRSVCSPDCSPEAQTHFLLSDQRHEQMPPSGFAAAPAPKPRSSDLLSKDPVVADKLRKRVRFKEQRE